MSIKRIEDYDQVDLSSDPNNRSILDVNDLFFYVYGRRSGNTTRKVDAMIQLLFMGYVVRNISKHFNNEKKILFNRLMYEHSFNRESGNKMRKGNDLVLCNEDNRFWLFLKK